MKKTTALQKLARVLVLSATAFGVVSTALAANPADWKTFTSTAAQNWNDSAKWTTGTGIPTSGTSLVISFDPSKSGTTTSSGKISVSFASTNDLGTVQLNALNLAGTSSSGSARTITIAGGTLQFGGATPTINNTTAGGVDTVLYKSNSSILLDADLGLNLNGTSAMTLLGAAGNSLAPNSAGMKTITVTGAGTCYLGATSTSVLSDGGSQLAITMAGTGVLHLGGANTFAGDVLVKSGTVRQNSTSAGTATSFGVGTIRLGDTAAGNADATLQLTVGGSGITYANPIIVQTGNSGTKTINNSGGNFTSTLGGLLTLNDVLTIRYSGGSGGLVALGSTTTGTYLTGVGNLTLEGNGTAGNRINGNNPGFTGNVTVNTGITELRSATALRSTNSVAVNVGATLDVRGVDQTLAGLRNGTSGGGTVTNTTPLSGVKTLTLGGGGVYSFDGTIAGNLALTVALTGGGTQTLGGVSTYTNATAVNSGALLVNGSLAAGNAVTVGVNGTLGGTGTVSRAVTVNGALSPGGSDVGTLTLASNVVFSANAKYDWGYQGGVGDAVTIAGDLTLPTSATVTVTEGTGRCPTPAVLFQAGSLSGPGATDLSGWTVTGAAGYHVAVRNGAVVLDTPPDRTTVLLLQ